MSVLAQTVARFFDAIRNRRFDEVATVVRPDADIHMPGGTRLNGPHELRPMLEAYLAGFPDMHHEIVNIVEGEKSVAVELVVTMTHTGTFATPMGDFPATGNKVVLDSCDVVGFDDAGLIASWHTYFDTALLMAQLGAGVSV